MIDTCGQAERSISVQGRFGGFGRADGISLVGFLFFVLLVYGIYTLVFKPGHKSGKSESEVAPPAKLNVVIYTTPSCEPCGRAKVWMTQRQIAFEERNVQASPVYEQELENYKSRIVPVIVVNGEPHYGFRHAHLDDALKNATRPHRD
jgi:glutaredoxin